MFKLLRAEFARMFASVIFLCGTALCLFAGALFVYMNTAAANNEIFVEGFLFSLYGLVMLVSAVFTAFFLGAEYSHGAIRNKLTIGHKRTDVYLADLITAVTGSLIFNAATMLPWVFVGKRVLLGCTEEELALRILTSFCAVAACTSLYTLFSLVIARPQISAAVTIIAAALLFLAPANNYSGVSFKEKLMMNVIPSCHLKKLALADYRFDKELDGIAALPLYSLGTVTVSSGIGIVIFSKKNLK